MAKKKSNMFKTKKEVEQSYKDSLLETVASGAGTILTGFGFNAVRDKLPETARRFAGLGVVGIGAAGNVFAKHSAVKAFSLGVSDFGFMQAIMDLKPDMGAKIAVMPKTVTNEEVKGLGKRVLTQEDYRRIAEELENSEEIETEENIEGLGNAAEQDQVSDLVNKML